MQPVEPQAGLWVLTLEAAAELIQLISSTGIGTRIEANEACLSACAWVFMLGRTNLIGFDNEGFAHRSMHFSSILGFHAPRLDIGTLESVTPAQLEQAQAAMNSAFALIMGFGTNDQFGPARISGWIEMDLILNAFEAGSGGEYFLIDTVGKAAHWGIDIYGYELPERADIQSLMVACTNLLNWEADEIGATHIEDIPIHFIDGPHLNFMQYNPNNGRIALRGLEDGMYQQICVFQPEIEDGTLAGACGFDEESFTDILDGNRSRCDETALATSTPLTPANALAVFPSTTLLTRIPVAANDITTRLSIETR